MTTGDANRSKEYPGPSFSGELPLHAIVQWIEDRYDVKFVVRDYGIVVADRDRLPPGALPLLDLASAAVVANYEQSGNGAEGRIEALGNAGPASAAPRRRMGTPDSSRGVPRLVCLFCCRG